MDGKDLPKHVWDLVAERYQSGEGSERISKTLPVDVPWDAAKAIMNKWRKWSTTETFPSGRTSLRTDERVWRMRRRKLTREAGKSPATTLKELQEVILLVTGILSAMCRIFMQCFHKGKTGIWKLKKSNPGVIICRNWKPAWKRASMVLASVLDWRTSFLDWIFKVEKAKTHH